MVVEELTDLPPAARANLDLVIALNPELGSYKHPGELRRLCDFFNVKKLPDGCEWTVLDHVLNRNSDHDNTLSVYIPNSKKQKIFLPRLNQFPCIRTIAAPDWSIPSLSIAWNLYKSPAPLALRMEEIKWELIRSRNLFDILSWDLESDREKIISIYVACGGMSKCPERSEHSGRSSGLRDLEKQNGWLNHKFQLESYVNKIILELGVINLVDDLIRVIISYL